MRWGISERIRSFRLEDFETVNQRHQSPLNTAGDQVLMSQLAMRPELQSDVPPKLGQTRNIASLLQQYGMNPRLPKAAQELARIIGLEATIELVKEEGGNEFRLPETVDGKSRMWERLVEIIGAEAAEKLVRGWPDTRVYVPLCTALLRDVRTVDIIERFDSGEPFDSIRRSYGFSRVHIYRLLKKAKPDFQPPTEQERTVTPLPLPRHAND